MPRVGGGVGLGEKCSLSEVADIKSSLVLENVQAVVILVFENDGISYINIGVFPL